MSNQLYITLNIILYDAHGLFFWVLICYFLYTVLNFDFSFFIDSPGTHLTTLNLNTTLAKEIKPTVNYSEHYSRWCTKYCPILTNHTSMESLFIQLSDDV